MSAVTNAQILSKLESFQKSSGEQREAIISGINDLNLKVQVANGKVSELYRDVRGDDRGYEGLIKQVKNLEKAHWKQAGAIGACVLAVEMASRFFK